MTKRVFQQQLSIGMVCALTLSSLLCLYFFWIKQGLLALLMAIVVVLIVERIIHTTYTFIRIARDEDSKERVYLVINKGRFVRSKYIALGDIVCCRLMRVNFKLSHYVLIEYGHQHFVAVQPQNEQAFIDEIKKRQKAEEASFQTKHS